MSVRKKPVKIALLFHGQGLDPAAEGIETLVGKSKTLERVRGITHRQAKSVLGSKLLEEVISSSKEQRTKNTLLNQLAAAYEGILLARAFFHYKPENNSAKSIADTYYGNKLDVRVAGHSIGEIVAAGFEPLLLANGKVADSGRFKKDLGITLGRGGIMLKHHGQHPDDYRMGVVIGKSDSFCEALVQLATVEYGEGSVSVSGHNSLSIHTIAGKVNAVSYVMKHAESSGAKVIERFNDYGFHDFETMHECAQEFKEFLKAHTEVGFSSYFPVTSSRNGKTLKRTRSLRADFWKGVEDPVMWHCDGSDHKNPGRGFVVDTLVRQGYNIHVVFARELKGWERELERSGQAEVIAVTDYNSLVEGYSRVLQLVEETSAVPYARQAPAERAMQPALSPQL